MMFGVAAVIAMLSIGAGAEQRALAMIERLGVHNVLVRAKEVPPSERAEARKKSMGLSPARRGRHPRGGAPRRAGGAQGARSTPTRSSPTGRRPRPRSGASRTATPRPPAWCWRRGASSTRPTSRRHAQVCVIGAARPPRSVRRRRRRSGRFIKVNDVWLQGDRGAGRRGAVARRRPAPAPGRGQRRQRHLPAAAARCCRSSSAIRWSRRWKRSWSSWTARSRRTRARRSSPACWSSCTAGWTTTRSWCPRRCWRRAARPSASSASSWAASPASRCWWGASAS